MRVSSSENPVTVANIESTFSTFQTLLDFIYTTFNSNECPIIGWEINHQIYLQIANHDRDMTLVTQILWGRTTHVRSLVLTETTIPNNKH